MQIPHGVVRLCALVGLLSASLNDAYSFLFFSSPSTGTIHQARILTAVEQSRSDKMSAKKLVGVESIKQPYGLAVDSLRNILYIIDGNEGKGSQLYAARIYHSKGGTVGCESPVLIASNVASHWVAVDFRGKVFFVSGNQIWAVPASIVTGKLDGTSMFQQATANKKSTIVTGNREDNDQLPDGYEMVYDGDSVSGVNVPHGLAVDGYRLFWNNGQNGKKDGTVVSGLEAPLGGTETTKVATNLAKAYGICLTPQRIFYTDEESNVFSTKSNGGPPITVTDKLQRPRGCAWDGDGTVFIADKGADKIVSFAGAAAELGPRKLSLAIGDVKEPFGLAVLLGKRDTPYSGAAHLPTLLVAIATSLFGLTY